MSRRGLSDLQQKSVGEPREMPLDDELLRLFKRACAEGQADVADKLLQALELLDQQSSERGGSGCIRAAYLHIAREG